MRRGHDAHIRLRLLGCQLWTEVRLQLSWSGVIWGVTCPRARDLDDRETKARLRSRHGAE